jgi:hypothetical protein
MSLPGVPVGLWPIRKLSSGQQLQRNGKQECFSLRAKSPIHLLNIEAHLPPAPGTRLLKYSQKYSQ